HAHLGRSSRSVTGTYSKIEEEGERSRMGGGRSRMKNDPVRAGSAPARNGALVSRVTPSQSLRNAHFRTLARGPLLVARCATLWDFSRVDRAVHGGAEAVEVRPGRSRNLLRRRPHDPTGP